MKNFLSSCNDVREVSKSMTCHFRKGQSSAHSPSVWVGQRFGHSLSRGGGRRGVYFGKHQPRSFWEKKYKKGYKKKKKSERNSAEEEIGR